MTRSAVWIACGASLVIGLVFLFVWAPHPWGWRGFDDYQDFGLALARGGSFPTIDRPWGYAYYLALSYRLFGERPWIPLVGQVALNALMPWLVYLFARVEFDERVAVVAALTTGWLSFNTVYASTASSDAICTVLFMAAVLLFARARRRGDWRLDTAAGALLGLATQFRPNLALVPLLLAALTLAERRRPARWIRAVVLVAASTAALTPWIVRNHRLTGDFIPTSTHGGLQLWYGTLQTGQYLKSRAYNPRAVFESGSFPYTSLDRVPLIVTARLAPCADRPTAVNVVYWTDRDSVRHRVPAATSGSPELRAELPPSPAPTVYYFGFPEIDPRDRDAPYVYFVSADHLGDLDAHGDVLDVFDIVRLLRHLAWNEPVPAADRLDLDGDGRLTGADLRKAVASLAEAADRPGSADVRVKTTTASAALLLDDGSSLAVPKAWSGRITDVAVKGAMAEALLHTAVPFSRMTARDRRSDGRTCTPIEDVAVNAPFYREEPQAMRRYLALALDNIRRDPPAYAASVAYRALRVFLIEGTDDPHTAQQFSGSGRVYRAAFAASSVLFVLFVVGVWTAWRRGAAIVLPLLLIAYIPATLAFVLTNMRYSITVQPLIFVFIASAVVTALEASGRWPRLGSEAGPGAPGRADTETAPRP